MANNGYDEFEKDKIKLKKLKEGEEASYKQIRITASNKQVLEELKRCYKLKDWDDCIFFFVENMKKVPLPKSEFFG